VFLSRKKGENDDDDDDDDVDDENNIVYISFLGSGTTAEHQVDLLILRQAQTLCCLWMFCINFFVRFDSAKAKAAAPVGGWMDFSIFAFLSTIIVGTTTTQI